MVEGEPIVTPPVALPSTRLSVREDCVPARFVIESVEHA
jgi:hypothetical protein